MMSMKDKSILVYYREDARISLQAISKQINVPASTIFDRLHFLEDDKVVLRYVAMVDFQKAGFDSRAYLLLRVKKDNRERVREFLTSNCNVNSLSSLANGYDFVLEAIFPSMEEQRSFRDDLENLPIDEIVELFALKDIKREAFNLGGVTNV